MRLVHFAQTNWGKGAVAIGEIPEELEQLHCSGYSVIYAQPSCMYQRPWPLAKTNGFILVF
jgi:hypothetical protein